jgi:hypothetical protein
VREHSGKKKSGSQVAADPRSGPRWHEGGNGTCRGCRPAPAWDDPGAAAGQHVALAYDLELAEPCLRPGGRYTWLLRLRYDQKEPSAR